MKKSHKKLEIILSDRVEKLGKRGDKINVAKGYAINYLIPNNLAYLISDHRAKIIMREINKNRETKEAQIKKAAELAQKINGSTIKISKKKGVKDKLFGSITKKDVLQELEKKIKIKLSKAEIIGSLPIKKIGEYKIKIKLASNVEPEIKLKITGKA